MYNVGIKQIIFGWKTQSQGLKNFRNIFAQFTNDDWYSWNDEKYGINTAKKKY